MDWLKGVWNTIKDIMSSFVQVMPWNMPMKPFLLFVATGLIIVIGVFGTVIDPQLIYIIIPQGHISPTQQNVIVFVGGINTKNTSDTKLQCTTDTFKDLAQALASDLHITDPYNENPQKNGCTYANIEMKDKKTSFVYFSYKGGALNPNTGVWEPAPYIGCDPDTISLQQDVSTFVQTLHAYQAFYPNAHFTIVAHSLGGLVALEGAAKYESSYGSDSIDKLITIDSPLHGVLSAAQSYPQTNKCDFFIGPIAHDLGILHDTPELADQLVTQLEKSGTSIYTLGNNDDCLYQNVVACGVKGQELNDPETQYVQEAYVHHYTISEGITPNLNHDGSLNLVPGHGAILNQKENTSFSDLIKFVLAPHIHITLPRSNSTVWSGVEGVPLMFSATVHCDWGTSVRATAQIVVPNSPPYFVGTFARTDTYTLTLLGAVNLPTTVVSPDGASFNIDSSNACDYSNVADTSVRPTGNDYLYGNKGVPLSFGNGSLAIGTGQQLYIGQPSNGSISNTPLTYPDVTRSGKSITALDWAHDGTGVAFLVPTGSDTNGTLSTLYITSSQATKTSAVATQLANAVALTWSPDDSKIAILQEAEGKNDAAPGPAGYYFTPSLLIVDAHTGAKIQQFNISPSGQTFVAECGENCLPSRARLEWGANGMFFASYTNSGNMLVTATGQATQIDPQQAGEMGVEGMEGAMDTQGTLIAYPSSDANEQVTVNLTTISASGVQGTPSVLATLPQSSVMPTTSSVDISPDGTTIGVCNGPDVFVLNLENPTQLQPIMTLPVDPIHGSLVCSEVRWSADGQSLLLHLEGIDTRANGLMMLSVKNTTGQLLFGCNISYTSPSQPALSQGQSCDSDITAFAMQPIVPDESSTKPLSSEENNSQLLAQSGTMSAQTGEHFFVYFDFQNTGKTTWTHESGYTLDCDQYYMPSSSCMEAAAQPLDNVYVQPGQQVTFYVPLTAPSQPGTYQTSWDMHYQGHIFGKNHVYITVNVSAATHPLTDIDWANFTYTSSCFSNSPQQFTTHNSIATINGITLTVKPPVFGDLTGDGQSEAAVGYDCVGADDSGGRVLVYSGTADNPVLLADLPSINDPLGSVFSVKIVSGILELSGPGYALGDAHCCPSLQVTTNYTWNGSQFVIVSSTSAKAS